LAKGRVRDKIGENRQRKFNRSEFEIIVSSAMGEGLDANENIV